MDTWHSIWFKSKTRSLSGASEHMGNGTTAKSGNWDSDMEPGLPDIRHDVERVAAQNQANGCSSFGGKRVMHAFCSMCMAWHSGTHGRAEKTDRPDWAHGGHPHRSRECALTVVQQSQWRLNELGLGCVLSNFDGTNAFGATRRELLISTAQKAAKENDRMLAADSLQHGSMTLQARDGPVTLMPSSGAQMGFTLAPRDCNDCCNPKMDQWRQNLRTVDCTNDWLDAVNTCDPSRRVVDLSSATLIDDISRIQIFAAPPSVAEVVFKMNEAHSLLEESREEGDWTLTASKCHHDERGGSERDDQGADRQAKRAAMCGLLGGMPSRTLFEGERKYYCRKWKESDSGMKRMETMRKILEGKGTKEVKTTHVHLLRARCCTVGTDEHGAGTKTLRSP